MYEKANLARTIIHFIAYASNFRYNWTQTLEEIDLRVPLPMALKGKDLIVEIKRKHLKVTNHYIMMLRLRPGFLLRNQIYLSYLFDSLYIGGYKRQARINNRWRAVT